MNDFEQEQFAEELRRLRPAASPGSLTNSILSRLRTSGKVVEAKARAPWTIGLYLGRWLVPLSAAAVLMLAALARWLVAPGPLPTSTSHPATSAPSLPEDVQIDRQLVAVFDAVARLPSGERVRFRCREWRDETVLHDPANQVVIERAYPRVEITPIRFETD